MAYVAKDMSGQVFGAWTVMSKSAEKQSKRAYWKCICKCGAERVVLGSNLRSGASQSCGCRSHVDPQEKKDVSEKFCPKCSITKSASEFHKNASRNTPGRDGLAVYCKQCSSQYSKEKKYDKSRWENNKEHEYARHKAFIAKNRDKQLERMSAKGRRYRIANKGKVNAANRARAKWNFVPKWADKSAMRVVYEKAAEWSQILGEKIEVDHIVPLRGKTVCGLHCESNLQLLAKELNHQKRHFFWPDMPI